MTNAAEGPPPPIRITDPDDERIALFHAIKERDRIGRDGVLIAEGATVLNVLVRSNLETIAFLIDEKRAPTLGALSARGTAPLYVASQDVLDRIAGFHLHRGILAAARIPRPHSLDLLPDGPLRLPVLVGLSNHDNVGGIYRNAAAFGAAAVAIDSGTASPFYRKAIRVGVGAPLVMPTIPFDDPHHLIGALHARGIAVLTLSPGAAGGLQDAPLPERAAFVFGTEGPGLPDALIAAATPLAIKIASGFDSLNVAATSAIVLHAHALAHGISIRFPKRSSSSAG
ncbi:MAG: RNA methyltransferase [Pseudomonadota bacterium]